MPVPVRVSVCLNSGSAKGKPQAALVLSSDSTEILLAAAANKLRLKKKDVERAKLFVWRTGAELPRHHDWPSGAVRDDSLIAISLGEPYAGPSAPPPSPLAGTSLLPNFPAKLEPIAPPGVSGSDDCGNRFANLVELWAEQAAERTAYYAANQTFWDEDGYAGSTDEEAMIGDATTSATDVEHSLKLIDELRAKHPSLLLRTALDCGAGVGRVTKHVLLKRCEHVCLLEGCERWLKQARRYLGNKRAQSCKFVLGRLEESAALEACGVGSGRGGSSRGALFDLIWIQWTLQYLVDADVVSTLRRLRSAISPNGRLVLKENRPCMHTVGTEEGFQVDKPSGPNARYDVCRPDTHHRWLFRCASLVVEHTEQHGEITAWVLRAADDSSEVQMLLQPTLDAAAMAAAAAAARAARATAEATAAAAAPASAVAPAAESQTGDAAAAAPASEPEAVEAVEAVDGVEAVEASAAEGAAAAPSAGLTVKGDGDWRASVRECVLSDVQPFVCEDELVWLDAQRFPTLLPLASLAECGRSNCACTRSLHPHVRRRFREEVVKRAVAAQAEGHLPADGRLVYVSLGSGLLLGDLDVICGLQLAGFSVLSATFIDTDYRDNCDGALTEVDEFLEGRTAAFTSAAAYAMVRLQGGTPLAHLFVQIDSDEIGFGDALALSAVALVPNAGLGFRLANRHHPTLLPMVAWRRVIPVGAAAAAGACLGDPFSAAFEHVVSLSRTREQGAQPSGASECAEPEHPKPLNVHTAYADVLRQVDVAALIAIDPTPVHVMPSAVERAEAEAGSSGAAVAAAADSATAAPGTSAAAATDSCKECMDDDSDAALAHQGFPSLAEELLVVIVSHLPIHAIARVASRLSCEWARATRSQAVWAAVLHRRWGWTSLEDFGARFPGGWRQLFHVVRTLQPLRANELLDRWFYQGTHKASPRLCDVYDPRAVADPGVGDSTWRLSADIDADIVLTVRNLDTGKTCTLVDSQAELRNPRAVTTLTQRRQPRFPSPRAESEACVRALAILTGAARRFLLGIGQGGFFPTHDGIFTYHEEAATPVHYRHRALAETRASPMRDLDSGQVMDLEEPLLDYHPHELRVGGGWEWSCDRIEWFGTEALSPSRGCFGVGWQLVNTNREIVSFLHQWPLMPLVRRESAYYAPLTGVSEEALATAERRPLQSTWPTEAEDDALWLAFHKDLCLANSRQVSQCLAGAITSDEPTTPCVQLRVITQHRYLEPPWLLRPQQWGWQVQLHSAAQASVGEQVAHACLVDDLLTRHVMVPIMGPHGAVSRPVRLYSWLNECEHRLRDALGLDEATFDAAPATAPQFGVLNAKAGLVRSV